jgi:hypothetical protein
MKIYAAILAALIAFGSAPAAAQSLSQSPSVHLDVTSAKPAQTLAFTGTGFEQNETVDVSLGDQSLTSATADDEGRIVHATLGLPVLSAGDYTLSFVGRTSQIPVVVSINIQGVRPWVVLSNYYVSQQSGVGFTGWDFVPGEMVAVYLNSTLSPPLVQLNADGGGRLSMATALTPVNLTGDNQLIFVGQQSQAELTATFTVAAP